MPEIAFSLTEISPNEWKGIGSTLSQIGTPGRLSTNVALQHCPGMLSTALIHTYLLRQLVVYFQNESNLVAFFLREK